jgi:hypothetical protein
MNEREKNVLYLMTMLGAAVAAEARKSNIDQDRLHSIVVEPETGYVDAYVIMDGKYYHATRSDLFPKVVYREENVNER